jgi:tRNA U34 5-methylaminomethyl-2-thiouridine-forming methyltransferase MnmC
MIYTADGSHSILIPELKATYHSIHGAIQESKHVFIEAGLKSVRLTDTTGRLAIFEVGFGTGLNTLLTLIEAENLDQGIFYETVELFPLNANEVRSLNYCEILHRNDLQIIFEQLHFCDWEREISIASNFTFKKIRTNLLNFQTKNTFELIFFDAFAPNTQPELWTEAIFQKMFSILQLGGVLVTYCSKGNVRRAMQSAGFIVEKVAGPPGKREMIRAAHPKVI